MKRLRDFTGKSVSAAATVAEQQDQPQKLCQGNGGGGHISHGGGGQGLFGAPLLFLGKHTGLLNGIHSPAAGVEFHRQGNQLKYNRKSEAGDTEKYQRVGETAQHRQQQACQNQGHGHW